jgi:alcohol dehydrogenase YqhD (iron-dependent ADH family)
MKYVYKHDIKRFARFANRVFDIEYRFDDPERTALDGIAALEAFYKALNLPTRLSDIDVDDKHISEMAKKGSGNNSHTLGNFVELDQAAIESILKLAL